ncbi:MAG: chromate transporter [Bacteroidetes bacterium]|nr:MAG: chromate transporter [Bacteroidota bacterium]
MKFIRHLPFLRAVFLHSITAFGGPQGHYGMMMRRFVVDTPYTTERELMEFSAFCQMLPGASSTQTLTLIGYKRGGAPLAIVTLLIWILPAGLLLSLLSFFFNFTDKRSIEVGFFKFIQPMAVGFLLYAAAKAGSMSLKNSLTVVIAAVAAVVTYRFFNITWLSPILLAIGGLLTNFNRKRSAPVAVERQSVKWLALWVFAAVFLVVGVLSEIGRIRQKRTGIQQAEYRIWNLSENFYRFGSLVFGGGDVLVPLMYEQFVVRPKPENQYMTPEQFLTGSGMVRAIPGPVFSVAAYHGGMAMRRWGVGWQVLGCCAGLFFIFLPSLLLVLFFYPVWNNLKKYPLVYRALEGINAVVVGIMVASCFYLMKDISFGDLKVDSFLNVVTMLGTFLVLRITRIPSPLIVLGCLVLGWLF